MIVSISASVFDQWIGALNGESALSMRQIGKMSGVSSGHLSVSRTRGVMPPAAVFGVAQAYGLDPLEEIARFPGFEIAWPAPSEETPIQELDGDLLRRGDQLVRVQDRPVPGEPVVAFNDGKRLRLIYEGFFGVSVATHEFTAGVPCAVRRGTDEIARTQPPEDQD
ncbi:hypothetical protein ACIGDM_12955 [Rothia koreensis]|uniref:hypothetical protein n=1 Tax=Rothia koreensis TaxID=592378 RepID=UPI0037C63FB1